jgi:hypothetical protein
MLDMAGNDPVLVHGTVANTSDGRRIAHAWVEVSQTSPTVWEPQSGRFVSLEIFWAHAKPAAEKRYTVLEAVSLAGGTGHFGPWSAEDLEHMRQAAKRADRLSEKGKK